jgi:hypothetical protein
LIVGVETLAFQNIISQTRKIKHEMAGHFRASPGEVSQLFPARPQFSGFMKPCRFEGEVQDLEVQGAIPSEIDGTFYRVMPDPQFVPFIENDPVCTISIPALALQTF